MTTIDLVTTISAPVARCFDLARSIDLHLDSARKSREQAIDGVTSGLIGLGQSVTWRARHLGIIFTLTSRIVEMERGQFFRDAMVTGPFSHLEHDHHFERQGEATAMRDILRFTAPCGLLGRAADRLLIAPHLRRFLRERNAILKDVAESKDRWQHYLPEKK